MWAEKAAECVRLRGAFQDQQAAGLMTLEELENTRRMAEAEIAALAAREERAEELERPGRPPPALRRRGARSPGPARRRGEK